MSLISLRPSGAKRWSVCTASPRYILENADRLPKDDGSKWATEGGQAAALAEAMLSVGEECIDLSQYPEEMVIHMRDYVRQAKRLSEGGESYVETKIPIYFYPEIRCTPDYSAVVRRHGKTHVIILDLKYGAGVEVPAERNPQLAIYARSFARHHELGHVDSYTIAIYQPRCGAKGLDAWIVSEEELTALLDPIEQAATGILLGDAGEFHPDDATCQFCPAKGICKARATDLLADTPVAEVMPREITLPAPSALSDDAQAEIVRHASTIEKWLADVRKHVFNRMEQGVKYPGLKIVAGTGRRAWTDEDAAAKLLKNYLSTEEIFERSLVSPAQAEKRLVGKELSTKFRNKFDALITKPEGKPTLVSDDDPRPALGGDFDIL